MKVTDYIVQFLKGKGVTSVFELSGGMIMQLIDSFHLDGTIKLISIHHEQSASFAADAVGRMTGIPGVAMATSGPGATNLITGIGSCYFDSSPAIFITGQVNTHEQKGDKNIRQLGFQETDIVSIVKSITKYAVKITSVDQVQKVFENAFDIATSGRPGPVLIDIPMDIFRATIEVNKENTKSKEIVAANIPDEIIQQLLTDLKKSERPLILAGAGIRASGAYNIFLQLIEKLNVPVVSSLLAIDVLPFDNALHVGMIGTYGNRWANISLYNSDFLLVLGSRLDIKQTGADTKSFKGDKIIYHVDCEAGEINNRVTGCVSINVDLKDFINKLKSKINDKLVSKKEWEDSINALKEKWPDTKELQNIKGINPNYFMQALSIAGADIGVYVADVGQHQMWAAQSLRLNKDQRFITSGGMGAMGFALPAAIGVSITDATKPTCVIAGDAGFQLNIQELQTVVRNQLPIKIVIINNQCQGMTRQFQESYFSGRYQSTIWGYSVPDFEKIANAYGIQSATIMEEKEIPEALKKMNETKGPFLLDVRIDTFANAYPKMAFGLPISEMEPYARPMDMEST
ncbi:MAG TPA: thiamine pyrophosphate-binding protein [Ferruginibacter sp.]|nr:thiamine pyrophosphate-binding protein [Ferruginibacter sp.]